AHERAPIVRDPAWLAFMREVERNRQICFSPRFGIVAWDGTSVSKVDVHARCVLAVGSGGHSDADLFGDLALRGESARSARQRISVHSGAATSHSGPGATRSRSP